MAGARRAAGQGSPEGTSPPSRRWLPDWRNLLVAVLVPALLFAGLEGLLALLGVRPVLYEKDPYVGFSSYVPLFVEQRQADGGVALVTARNKLRLFNKQRFPLRKGPRAYRVFCLGGSTTYGRPYGDVTSFCGWLREFLPAADPSRDWEVINAGGISYASYRVALLEEELIGYRPDLFIVYSGHNEFLEERTYGRLISTPRAVRGLGALVSRTRTFAAMRRAVLWLGGEGRKPPQEAPRLQAEVTTLLDRSVGPGAYHRDDAQRRQILRHFRFNLARMVDIAGAAGARTIFVTPAANLRHSSPFKSEHRAGLAAAEETRWQVLYDDAETALAGGHADQALAALDGAAQIDDRYADLHYLRGRALDELGRYREAKTAFERARDEDVCPLRAVSPMAEVVAEVAAERRVPVVDFVRMVEERAPQRIPGEESFFDHVHPRIDGNRRLALALLETMEEMGIVRPAPSWGEESVRQVSERVLGGLDSRAHGLALLNLSKVLGWAGKLEEARKLAVQATALAPEAEVFYQAGVTHQLSGQVAEAIPFYRRALQLAPDVAVVHGNLAAALEAQGATLQAIYHYRRALALIGDQDPAYRRQISATLVRLGATPD